MSNGLTIQRLLQDNYLTRTKKRIHGNLTEYTLVPSKESHFSTLGINSIRIQPTLNNSKQNVLLMETSNHNKGINFFMEPATDQNLQKLMYIIKALKERGLNLTEPIYESLTREFLTLCNKNMLKK